jgi:hypothetical protein
MSLTSFEDRCEVKGNLRVVLEPAMPLFCKRINTHESSVYHLYSYTSAIDGMSSDIDELPKK